MKIPIIIGLLFLVGCEEHVNSGDKIYGIEGFKQYPNKVYYQTWEGGFWGPKGLYNIGDTVKFCK